MEMFCNFAHQLRKEHDKETQMALSARTAADR